jgi:hypothetical protein
VFLCSNNFLPLAEETAKGTRCFKGAFEVFALKLPALSAVLSYKERRSRWSKKSGMVPAESVSIGGMTRW